MIYNWTQLGIKEITNLYLYGTPQTPDNLGGETWIRPKDISETVRFGANIKVDMASYMQTGPGRFALGSESVIVQEFFSIDTDLSWMAAGVQYTKADVISHLKLKTDSDRINIKQVNLADMASDYIQRAYVWNSGLFKLADDATFSVDSAGKRSIQNYSIRAFNDNFDFVGGGVIAEFANAQMEPRIDPWKIGRKINIEFVDAGLPKKTYTIEDLSRENLQHISHITSGTASLAMLPAGALSIINELWVSGVTQNIYDGKPIIYGTDGADTLKASQINDLPLLSPLRIYGNSTPEKGVAIFAGSGADTLEGKDGADYLEGGADADTYVLQTGLTGIDTLVDSGANTLQVGGKTVSGAFAQVAGMGGDIYYSADKSYQLRKAENGVWRLAAKDAGTGQYSAVADLKGWKDGDYGLTIGAPTQEPERIAPVVYPSSNAYLAMDGAAAPKGVTFGGGNKSDSFNDTPRFCVLRKACRAQNRRRGATHSIATGDLQASARCQFNHQHCSAGGIA